MAFLQEIDIVCMNDHGKRGNWVARFQRYPDGYFDPGAPDDVYHHPYLWVFDQFVAQGQGDKIDGIHDWYDKANPNAMRSTPELLICRRCKHRRPWSNETKERVLEDAMIHGESRLSLQEIASRLAAS